jgi:hypothetical protein
VRTVLDCSEAFKISNPYKLRKVKLISRTGDKKAINYINPTPIISEKRPKETLLICNKISRSI